MGNLGPNSKAISGPTAALTIAGNVFLSAENWTLRVQYKVLEEPVSNTNLPYYGTSTYHGEFDCDAIGTTDNKGANGFFALATTLTNGDLVVRTGVLSYTGQDGSTVTYTFTGRFHDAESQQRKGEFVRFALKCVLNAVPTET